MLCLLYPTSGDGSDTTTWIRPVGGDAAAAALGEAQPEACAVMIGPASRLTHLGEGSSAVEVVGKERDTCRGRYCGIRAIPLPPLCCPCSRGAMRSFAAASALALASLASRIALDAGSTGIASASNDALGHNGDIIGLSRPPSSGPLVRPERCWPKRRQGEGCSLEVKDIEPCAWRAFPSSASTRASSASLSGSSASYRSPQADCACMHPGVIEVDVKDEVHPAAERP